MYGKARTYARNKVANIRKYGPGYSGPNIGGILEPEEDRPINVSSLNQDINCNAKELSEDINKQVWCLRIYACIYIYIN
jgi:hypothetical protein